MVGHNSGQQSASKLFEWTHVDYEYESQTLSLCHGANACSYNIKIETANIPLTSQMLCKTRSAFWEPSSMQAMTCSVCCLLWVSKATWMPSYWEQANSLPSLSTIDVLAPCDSSSLTMWLKPDSGSRKHKLFGAIAWLCGWSLTVVQGGNTN